MDKTILTGLLAKMNKSYADVSGVTATAEDVAQGKYFVDSSKELIEGTASGGGPRNATTKLELFSVEIGGN